MSTHQTDQVTTLQLHLGLDPTPECRNNMRSLSGGLRHGRQGARGPSEGQSNHYHALSVKRTGTEGWKEGSVKGISQACLQFSSVMKPQPGNREQRGRAGAIVEMCLALLRLNSLKKVKGGMPAHYPSERQCVVPHKNKPKMCSTLPPPFSVA